MRSSFEALARPDWHGPCARPPRGRRSMACTERWPGSATHTYLDAKLIVVWGANPSTTGIHLVPYIQDAQKAGATLVVIDPRRTPLARRADLHLAVRPGTDLAVALAVHAYLFDQGLADEAFLAAHTRGSHALRERAHAWPLARAAEVAGIEASQLETFARLYGETSPAVIRCGWGLERNRNGGSAAAAILALPAVAGKFGVQGGGYTMSNSGAGKRDPTAWGDAEEPATRVINMNRLGRTLLEGGEPPIKMLFIYNCNPVATMPDQNRVLRGLQREDLFTVVFDQVVTDTAEFADVILPATTFLESYDVAKGYGSLSIQIVQPAIEAVGEARPNVQVFRELAARLGISVKGDPETDAEALLQVLPGPSRGGAATARRGRVRRAAVRAEPGPVRRRISANSRRQSRPVSGAAGSGNSGRTLRIPARPGRRWASTRLDLSGQRQDDQLEPG